MAQRGELGRQLPLRGPLKALEADIHHANAMADAIQRNYGGSCVQMRLSFSSLAPLFLYFIQWLDCGCCYALPSYLGLFHILICKVYADGDSSVSTYERRASLREFYGDWVCVIEASAS
ncbi:RING/U-box superfamily protein [Zea mays]|uniref:RING/U-box superfamily protein n=1 Tax=Zea mays TaxID=4577 RepID=A0A1D6HPW0_MAIZE|nr:RING/U-box superfamily protein [Zea mays]ONM40526.1 RING/U-box superfamily protein [Zea mays]